jgi:hypothetical protein
MTGPRILLSSLIVVAALSNGAASAQPLSLPSQAEQDVRTRCREAARKICNAGISTDRTSFRQCVTENADKLPPECAAARQRH